MRRVLLVLAVLVALLGKGQIALSQVFTMNVSERSEAYRWLVRLSVDVDMVRTVAAAGMAEEGEALQPDMLYHDKWLVNEWFLEPSIDELFAGDKVALKKILHRLDQCTDGFDYKGKKVRFVKLLDFVDRLQSISQVDFGKPSQTAKQKAYKQLFERGSKEFAEIIKSALAALDKFVADKQNIVSEEKGFIEATKSHSAKHFVTYVTLLRLESDLKRMRKHVVAEKQSQSISLGSNVLEYRTAGTNSWYVQQHHLDGLSGLRHTLDKRLNDMDSQSTGVFINGKAHRYSDLVKLIDRLSKRLERDYGNPDRSEMQKAIDELVARMDVTTSLAKSLREKLPALESAKGEEGNPELGFDGLNMMEND